MLKWKSLLQSIFSKKIEFYTWIWCIFLAVLIASILIYLSTIMGFHDWK